MTRREAERLTRREAERQTHQTDTLIDLIDLGFTRDEAEALRRISMTLHRWYELECGDSNEYGSWAIERDENGGGPPFMVRHSHRSPYTVTRYKVADRERGALVRLAKIMNARNTRLAPVRHTPDTCPGRPCSSGCDHVETGRPPLSTYLQTDPRGAALYILRPGDVPEGGDPSSYYTRGICVY